MARPMLDFAVHWMEKQKRIRLRFMVYWARNIHIWYWPLSSALSKDISQTRQPYQAFALFMLFFIWPVKPVLYHLFIKDYSDAFRLLLVLILLIGLGIAALIYFLVPLAIFLPEGM